MSEYDWKRVKEAFKLVHDNALHSTGKMVIEEEGVWKVYATQAEDPKERSVIIMIGVG